MSWGELLGLGVAVWVMYWAACPRFPAPLQPEEDRPWTALSREEQILIWAEKAARAEVYSGHPGTDFQLMDHTETMRVEMQEAVRRRASRGRDYKSEMLAEECRQSRIRALRLME